MLAVPQGPRGAEDPPNKVEGASAVCVDVQELGLFGMFALEGLVDAAELLTCDLVRTLPTVGARFILWPQVSQSAGGCHSVTTQSSDPPPSSPHR